MNWSDQPQSITALWPILISCPTEGRRLSRPGWLGKDSRVACLPIAVLSEPNVEQLSWSKPACYRCATPPPCHATTGVTSLRNMMMVFAAAVWALDWFSQEDLDVRVIPGGAWHDAVHVHDAASWHDHRLRSIISRRPRRPVIAVQWKQVRLPRALSLSLCQIHILLTGP